MGPCQGPTCDQVRTQGETRVRAPCGTRMRAQSRTTIRDSSEKHQGSFKGRVKLLVTFHLQAVFILFFS